MMLYWLRVAQEQFAKKILNLKLSHILYYEIIILKGKISSISHRGCDFMIAMMAVIERSHDLK